MSQIVNHVVLHLTLWLLSQDSLSSDALMDHTGGVLAVSGENATANIFASYPAKHLSVLNGFVDQVRCKTCLFF